jgi:hypothetical protein
MSNGEYVQLNAGQLRELERYFGGGNAAPYIPGGVVAGDGSDTIVSVGSGRTTYSAHPGTSSPSSPNMSFIIFIALLYQVITITNAQSYPSIHPSIPLPLTTSIALNVSSCGGIIGCWRMISYSISRVLS